MIIKLPALCLPTNITITPTVSVLWRMKGSWDSRLDVNLDHMHYLLWQKTRLPTLPRLGQNGGYVLCAKPSHHWLSSRSWSVWFSLGKGGPLDRQRQQRLAAPPWVLFPHGMLLLRLTPLRPRPQKRGAGHSVPGALVGMAGELPPPGAPPPPPWLQAG